MIHRASIDEIRKFYAKLLFAASKSDDPRLLRAFETVHREKFLPSPPWHILADGCYFETPSDDPAYVHNNALVALDKTKGINNGEPFLHAAWMGAAAPKAGDVITHIGAGMGYYTAILSLMALPGGKVTGYELDSRLAAKAQENLADFDNAEIINGDATALSLPQADLIYVNAGVAAPPVTWLNSLRPQGRMIFPWRPSDTTGLTLLVARRATGFEVKPLMASWFIPCVGASDLSGSVRTPDASEAWCVQSLWPNSARPPDETAVAVYEHLWFSTAPFEREDGSHLQSDRMPLGR